MEAGQFTPDMIMIPTGVCAAAYRSSGHYTRGAMIGNTFRLGDRVGFSLNFDARYRNVEGANVYQLINTDGVPIMLSR